MIKQALKLFVASLAILPSLFLLTSFTPVSAASSSSGPSSICDTPNVPDDVKASSGCSSGGTEISDSIFSILNSIIVVAGIIAVIYVIIGGIQYMTSGGDSGKLQKAKNTILYAVIGLVVCVLAFAIVNFAIRIIA